jgi:hypothetical protein
LEGVSEYFEKMAALLSEQGTGLAQAYYSVRLWLPISVTNPGSVKWESKGLTGLKNGVSLFPPDQIKTILNGVLRELNIVFRCRAAR